MLGATDSLPGRGSEWFRKKGNMLLVALFAWYVMDSTISLVTTFYLNAATNTIFLVFGWLAIRSYQAKVTE